MRRIAIAWMVTLAGMAQAGDWRDVETEAEARTVLSGRALVYESGATQEFRASGKTLYNAGQDSWGNWRLQGPRYCSEWPPAGGWSCYDLQTDGELVRFVGPGGEATVGRYTR